MKIPSTMIIKQTSHWIVNHRIHSALPGYIMLSATQHVKQLSQLPPQALIELATLTASIENALNELLKPCYLYISRYGHTDNLTIHFHFIPICQWVLDLFWQDDRYRQLQAFGADNPETLTDGAELTFFVWREFCERPDPPAYEGPSHDEIINILRSKLA